MVRATIGLLAVLALGAPAALAAPPIAPTGSATASSATSLATLVAALGDDALDVRRAAAAKASTLGAGDLGAITATLAELRPSISNDVRATLKSAQGASKGDIVEALVAAPRIDPATRRVALTLECLARSLAAIATTPAARQLVLLAGDAGGALRPELARLFTGLADRGVAALIEAKAQPSADVRAWAGGVLESLGKRIPGDAVQTTDPQILADVLRAYGASKDLDALGAILPFASAERAAVREAARDALVAYGADAAWKLREAYAQVASAPADPAWAADELARRLFAALDKARLRDVYALLDDGLAKEHAGDLAGAVAAFDAVLARQPELDRRGETVGGYYAFALSVEARDRPAASAALRKALALDPGGARAEPIRSELAFLEGEDLASRGVVDPAPYRRALELDGANARAEAALGRIDDARAESAAKAQKWATASAITALAVVFAILFAGGRRRSRA